MLNFITGTFLLGVKTEVVRIYFEDLIGVWDFYNPSILISIEEDSINLCETMRLPSGYLRLLHQVILIFLGVWSFIDFYCC